MLKASRWNKIGAAVLVGGAAMAVLWMIPWSGIIEDFSARRDTARGLFPLMEQARLWPMTYETATPGKPVVWCIDRPGIGVSYLEGRPLQPLLWVNEEELPPVNSPTSGGRCVTVVAVVEGRRPGGLLLRYVGRP